MSSWNVEGDARGALQRDELLEGEDVVHVRVSLPDLGLDLHVVDAVFPHAGLDDPVALHVAEGRGEDPVVVEGEVAGLRLAGDIHPGSHAHGLAQGVGEGLLTGRRGVTRRPPLGSDRVALAVVRDRAAVAMRARRDRGRRW